MIVQLRVLSQQLPQSSHCFHLFQHGQVICSQPDDINIPISVNLPKMMYLQTSNVNCTFSLDTCGHSMEYVAQRNSCITLSKAAPPYSLRLELGGFTGTLMPGQLLIPLCICSSSVVFPHTSGAGSAAPSSNARFHTKNIVPVSSSTKNSNLITKKCYARTDFVLFPYQMGADRSSMKHCRSPQLRDIRGCLQFGVQSGYVHRDITASLLQQC